MRFQRGIMPLWTELAAAADIRDRDGAPLGQPRLSCIEGTMTIVPIPRFERQFEAAVGIENGGFGPARVLRVNKEVRDFRAVHGRRFELIRNKAARIEARRLGFDRWRGACAVIGIKRYRLQKPLE